MSELKNRSNLWIWLQIIMKKIRLFRRFSLRYNVALKILLLILILSSLILIFIPMGLKLFFLEESYKTIEKAQVGDIVSEEDVELTIDPKSVNHVPLFYQGLNVIFPSNVKDINKDFLEEAVYNMITQETQSERYVYESNTTTIYYVVKKGANYALISYVYVSYVNNLVDTLYRQLSIIIIIVVFISLIIAFFLASSITNPLITISKKIKSISKNNWDDEIKVTRKDEIGDIQESLEEMRNHLQIQDKNQREMFQSISHDLKTPIMIIEGYAQAILDGYIKDEEIIEYTNSIKEEANRLEKKVKDLLLINKLEQLSLQKRTYDDIDVLALIQKVITPFKKQFPGINFILEVNSSEPLKGTGEEWRIAIENIVDNMTRFAKTEIKITYDNNMLVIFNDGEAINEDTLKKLFTPFGVGNKSNFGLGLAITSRIIKMFGYHISAENVHNGVCFKIFKKTE